MSPERGPCVTCGHRLLVHYPNAGTCITRGCTCAKFERAGGGDHDPRDQVGVDPTTPAHGDAEPVHPVWGYPFPAADPPDLQHAIQAATAAVTALPRPMTGAFVAADFLARVAVEAAAPVLLQATRDRLAALTDTARAVLSCLHAGNVFTAESLLRHALDGPAAQEEGGGG